MKNIIPILGIMAFSLSSLVQADTYIVNSYADDGLQGTLRWANPNVNNIT